MKINKISVFLLLAAISLLSAANYNYDNEFANGIEIISQNSSGVTYTFSIDEFSLDQTLINGRSVQQITANTDFLPNDAGNPDVPTVSRMIAVPENANVTVSYSWAKEEIINNVELAPAPRIPLETEDGLEYNWGKIYERDLLFPENMVQLSEIDEMRGVNYVHVSVNPFRYNPQKKELHFYRDIEVKLSFNGGNGTFGENRLRSRWWDPVLKSNLLNWESLPKLDYSRNDAGLRTPDYEYLIISPTGSAFTEWADSIRVFRTQQGIRTGVVTLSETGSSNTQIENYINNAYNSWDVPPVAVLFLGDYGTTASSQVNSPTWDSYCISDNLFADITGNDLPDLSTARITARDADELELMVEKFLDYERNPPTNSGFYQNPVVAGGWQTERWFILCTEVVRGFLANSLDKSPVREYAIYQGTPGSSWSTATNTSTVVNYFGQNGLGYLPSTPSVIPSWNANASSVNNDINNGCFILQHRDHGGETGWGEPDYGNSDLSGLNNEDLTFVFSTNCLTGKFNYSSESFAEAFHRHARGALGIIAATEVSYSFVNDTYVWGTYDYMWPEFDPEYGGGGDANLLPCFANSSGKWYLEASNWPYNTDNKEVTYYLFHHHGDAFTRLYSEIPQTIAVNHDDVILSGMSSVEVTAENGSFICLSVGDEILATADGTGNPQLLSITPQDPMTNVHIVVTKQNGYRYEADMLVIPPDGAYAIVNSLIPVTADDDVIEYNETVSLTAQIENFGNLAATDLNITISCEDPYINIIDNSASAASVDPGASIQISDAFSFSVADDVPDDHDFYITTLVAGSQDSWESTIALTAYAPVPQIGNISITGDSNANGRLDPGEVANLNVEILNEGGAELYNVSALLEETDNFCTIIQNPGTTGEIDPYSSSVFSWRVQVSSDATIGHVIEFDLACEADYNYSIQTSFALTVGLCLEDFESGGFSAYDWVMTGTGGWQISGSSYEGDYAAQSVDISDSQSTGIELEVNVLSADDISFYYSVSSESNYDFLRFYIDDNEVASWSGTVSWTQYSTPVSEGVHTLKWEYSKDYSVSNGSDCAWIDYIIFPPISIPQPAEMVLDNDQFNFVLLPETTGTDQLQITNIGGRDLEWNLSKNYVRSRQSGGPDNYGYQWLDSDEPNGPDFNWIDISNTGTQANFSNNDDAVGPFAIGFDFDFYGETETAFIINPNGWIGFGNDTDEWSNTSLPNSNAPRPAIMPFWDDLYPAIGNNGEGIVYYQNFSNYTVIMFDNVQHYPGNYNGNYSFEVVLYENGEFLIQYLSVSGDTDSATIGIQNSSASDALQVAYNSDYVENNLAVSFTKVLDWLQVSSNSGIIPISGNSTISLTVDSADLEIGDYLCNIVLNSNDPMQQTVTIPVSLFVGGDIAYGDIDDTGAVEAFDAALVLQYFVGLSNPAAPIPWESWRIIRADVDGNDSVEAFDASLILQYATGLINSFPVEDPRPARNRSKVKIQNTTSSSID